MNKLNNKTKGVILLSILILGGIGLYYFYVIKDDDIEIYENQFERNVLIPYENITESTENIGENTKRIVVDISGEIKNPGVYELEEGKRINDVIEKAGGLTDKADTIEINLAYKLEDGMKINIPAKSNTKEIDTEKEIVSTEAGSSIKTKDTNSTTKIKVVNINKATQEELETLPGIGESTANKIIKYREEKGKFKKKEDIKNVTRNRRCKV